MLITVAPSATAIAQTSAVNSTSARVASIGENSTSSQKLRACATAARACPLTSSRSVCSWWRDVDVRGRDERVDPRSLRVLDGVPRRLDVGGVRAREAGDDRTLDVARDLLHGVEVARGGDREPGLDHVDSEPGELRGDLDLLQPCSARCRATARRRGASCRRSRRARSSPARDPPGPRLHGGPQRSSAGPPSPSECEFPSDVAADAPPSANPPEGGAEAEGRGVARWSSRHAE